MKDGESGGCEHDLERQDKSEMNGGMDGVGLSLIGYGNPDSTPLS